MSVFTNPGATAYMKMLWEARASAMDWLKALSPALLAP
jgi:hypothetical protein